MPGLLHERDYDWSSLEELDAADIDTNTDEGFFAAAQAAIDIAHEVFVKHDVDDSGALDAEEMAAVVLDALHTLGSDIPPDIEAALTSETRVAYINTVMFRFDKDKSGLLEFSEFLQMLCCAPFRSLLPRGGIREKMPELVIKGAHLAPQRIVKKVPEKPPEQRVLELAQAIFEEADADKSGEVDGAEMPSLIRNFFRHCHKKIPFDIDSNMEDVTSQTMVRFDRDKTGTLDFNEFIAMLCTPPWKGLLPRELRDVVAAAVFSKRPPPPKVDRPKKKLPGAEQAMALAQQLFQEADADSSGFLDPQEVKILGTSLMQKMGRMPADATVPREILEFDPAKSMAGVDEDGDGTLNFDEFLSLVTQPPWSSLLPVAVCDALRQRLAAKLKFNPAPAHATPAERALLMAQDLFTAGDADQSGELDCAELAQLILKMFEKFKKKMPTDIRNNMEATVKKAMARFDIDGNGVLDFNEFMKMMCCNPWKGLLPPKIRNQLPALVLTGGVPAMPKLNKPQKEQMQKCREMNLLELLEAMDMAEYNDRFAQEGFCKVGDLLDVAFKLISSDFEELGIKNKRHQDRLLQVVRSGNPLDIVEKQQALQAQFNAPPGTSLSSNFEQVAMPSSSFSGSNPPPRRNPHPHLRLPGRPSATAKRSPCSPVRAPSRAAVVGTNPNVQSGSKVEWNSGLPANRPENSSWYDRYPRHRVKSRMSPMDRPKFPKDIINTQDSEMWRVVINQEARHSTDGGRHHGNEGYLFTG